MTIVQNYRFGRGVGGHSEPGGDGHWIGYRGRVGRHRVVLANANPSTINKQIIAALGPKCGENLVNLFPVDSLLPQEHFVFGQIATGYCDPMPLGFVQRRVPRRQFRQRHWIGFDAVKKLGIARLQILVLA